MDRARQPQPAGRRVAVRRVAEQEHATDRNEEASTASTDQRVILWICIGRSPMPSALRASASTCASDCARGIDRVVEVDHPLLRVGTPALRPHRHHHDEDAGLRREDPADQDVGVLRPRARSRRRRGASPSASRRRAPRTRRRSGRRPAVRRPRRAGTRSAPRTRARRRCRGSWRRTPSSSCSRSTSSWSKRIRPGESSSARAFSSGSSRICGRFSCRHGLAARQASSAPPAPQDSSRGQAAPVVRVRAGEARVERGGRHLLRPACCARAIASATPTSSSTSIARRFRTCAFGRSEVPGRALTSRCSTPWRARSIEAVSPAPPPPTIRTGTSSSALRVKRIVALLSSRIGVDVTIISIGVSTPMSGMLAAWQCAPR